jgi:predicted Zn-dependent peptidase
MRNVKTLFSAGALALLLLSAPRLDAQAPDRSRPPELGPPPALILEAIVRFELSNGLQVMYMSKPGVPLVQANLVVKAGQVNDPDGRPGLASMTAAMLDEGAGERDALELSEAIDFLGASIGVRSDKHSTTIALHTPVSRLDDALRLMADIALRPRFPAEELDRQRRQRLTAIMQARDEPRTIAQVIYNRTLFGENHPYGIPDIGTAQSLQEMNTDDLRQFHQRFFVPNNATLIVVGDVSREEMTPKLEAAFASWRRDQVPTRQYADVDQVQQRRVILVDKPGAAQSRIQIGRIGVDRKTADYYALVVMNTILGGSFASRINQNLREDKGYTYGAVSRFDFNVLPGAFTALSSVQTSVTDKALVEFFTELNGILEDVTEDEMTRARNFVALRYPSGFQAVSQIAGRLGQLYMHDLPDGYFNEYIQQILAVSKEDVLRVARRYIDPERVEVIVVGDRELIEEGVRALNLGPVVLMTVEDVLGPAPEISGT